MPADTMIIRPRKGHVDLPEGTIDAPVALSVEVRGDVTIVHVDVAQGMDIETPFSVGIPLAVGDVVALLASLASPNASQPGGGRPMDRLN